MALSSCGFFKPVTRNPANDTAALRGEASYYADKFDGRKTASGEVFDQDKLTAAHKTLPFGTRVEVKNLNNGKTVVVKINDRMPASNPRLIDLSKAAARKLDMVRSGIAPVTLTIIR
ncbi:MAG: septal ring lytic transglycosylase RlpA family protein [Bacteroidia bacterium]|nr:septal ring lytic transglycosylase RlpA family protein [Bacteroidia bacterium]